MHHLRNTLLILTLVAAITGGTYVFLLTQNDTHEQTVVSTSPKLPQSIAEAKEEERSVASLDGSKFLTMKMNAVDGKTTYSFFVPERTESLYSETFLGDGYSLGLPDNAWSPNDRYVFIEKNGGGVRDALVFQVNGEPFSNDEQYLDVYNLYQQKSFPNAFAGATGWADNNLLIIETVKEDGSKGSRYWFEVPSGAFIQLAR